MGEGYSVVGGVFVDGSSCALLCDSGVFLHVCAEFLLLIGDSWVTRVHSPRHYAESILGKVWGYGG